MIKAENVKFKQQCDDFQEKNDLLIEENFNLTQELNQLKNKPLSLDSQQDNGKFSSISGFLQR